VSVDQAVAAVRAGEPVVIPTDTVYGLCASPHEAGPVERMYRLKGRAAFHPTAVVAAGVETLYELLPELHGTPVAALLPGPFTLVLPNPERRFRWLTGSRPDTIGVRVPDLGGPGGDVLRAVGALAATSANLTGGRDPRRLEDVPEEIRAACGALVDGGELPGVPSTVVDLTGEQPAILREGAVPAADVLARLRDLRA
jgi:L-threonylcarbamoyladenylate synthase